MPNGRSNKHRLYISLLYRQNQDNFHWALTLAPKSERANTKSSVRYDAANTITAAWNGVQPVPWRYRCDPVDPLLDAKLVARVLVAKLPSRTSFEDWAVTIDQTCRAVPLVQNKPGWTCRTWAIEALGALRGLGGDFATIPDVQDGNTEEQEIVAFAQIAKAQLLAGEIPVGDIHAIALVDMRRLSGVSSFRSGFRSKQVSRPLSSVEQPKGEGLPAQ
ncbi:hypothetical protein B0H17DRAFT_1052298 [Mycena rosella]|uniref:Uncharacterized protein n=1 Tax=Mycena rosella TaxID=1033263 RepID=A0AAD7DSC7_MYCRO|nr:hypothetical protein B0H17DRAFT_1052298 [Mycena rosella]